MSAANSTIDKRPCSECGGMRSGDELVRLGSQSVCAACKPRALSKILEGAPLGTANRAQPHVQKDCVHLPADTQLPDRCVVCNAHAPIRLPQRYTPTFPYWLLPVTLLPFLGLSLRLWLPGLGLTGGTIGLALLIGAVILHPLLTPRPPIVIGIPLCLSHHRQRRRWLVAGMVFILLGLLTFGVLVVRFHGHPIPLSWLYGPGFLLTAGTGMIWMRLRILSLEARPDRSLKLRGATPVFRASLAQVDH